ncbi:MAG: sodium:proton antiporter [Staphylothermus sp.]|nr:sodium:proton antiporter [Staphylothermus sp.]
MRHILGLIIVLLFIIGFSLVLIVAGNYILPSHEIGMLAKYYLYLAYNPWQRNFTVMSPEAVTSIVWDFRGLDTVFETAVFYLAIIGSIALGRGIVKYIKPEEEELGLSLIVKTVTRISAVMIIAVAASIALHGHLTPGGGFQGGATAAVAPLLIIVIFSHYYLLEKGVTKDLMLFLRSLGLTGIAIVAIIVYLIALPQGIHAYVLQNQPKPDSSIGLPAYINGQLISGTLWFFNLFEFFAVMAGFTIVFLLITIPERAFRKEEEGEKQ